MFIICIEIHIRHKWDPDRFFDSGKSGPERKALFGAPDLVLHNQM